MTDAKSDLLVAHWDAAYSLWLSANALAHHALLPSGYDPDGHLYWVKRCNELCEAVDRAKTELVKHDPFHPALLKSRGYVPPKETP